MEGIKVICEPMNGVQARICLSPEEFELWNAEFRRRLEAGELVREAERGALEHVHARRQLAAVA